MIVERENVEEKKKKYHGACKDHVLSLCDIIFDVETRCSPRTQWRNMFV